jgi:hypothetical protein
VCHVPGIILNNLAQASLSQNAQWRSQKLFKPCAEYCNLFVGHNTREPEKGFFWGGERVPKKLLIY